MILTLGQPFKEEYSENHWRELSPFHLLRATSETWDKHMGEPRRDKELGQRKGRVLWAFPLGE